MSPLLYLIRLRWRSVLRRWRRGLGTTFGILAFLVFLLFVGSIAFQRFFILSEAPELSQLEAMRHLAPFFIVGMVLMNLLTTSGERAIYFSPAEVDFLFSAPFSRRQLLMYRLASIATNSLAFSIFMALMTMHFYPVWFYGIVGLTLTFLFITLAGILGALLREALDQRLLAAGKWLLGILVVGAAGIAYFVWAPELRSVSDLYKLVVGIQESWLGSLILAPFNTFADTALANHFDEFLFHSLFAITMLTLVLFAIFGLDVNYLEKASQISQKIYAQAKKQLESGGWATSASKGSNRFKLSPFPFWLGLGPMTWRQLLIAIRTGKSILFIFGFAALPFSVLIFVNRSGDDSQQIIGIVFAIVAYSSLLLSMNMPMGFRSEIDQMEVLKSLPIHQLSIVTGQLVGPVVLVSACQWLTFLVAGVITWGDPKAWLLFLVGASFCIPFNLIVFGLANNVFLLYPTRMEGNQADAQTFGVRMLVMFIQFAVLFLILGVVAALAGLTYFLTSNFVLTYIVAAACLLVFCILILLSTAKAFERYDPSLKLE